jgi:hypothetical protein
VGGFFQHGVKQHPQTTVESDNAVSGHISVTVPEWLLVLYVRMGAPTCRVRSPRSYRGSMDSAESGGERYRSRRRAVDTVDGLDGCLCSGWRDKCGARTPSAILQSITWIPVALSAGFWGELAFAVIFRSNFRRSQVAWGGQFLSKRQYLELAICTKDGPVARISLFGVLSGCSLCGRRV